MDNESVVIYGDTIKALGDGRIGGYLVRFSDAETPDMTGEFFTKSTDFAIDWDATPGAAVYYNHGLDPVLGPRTIGKGAMKAPDSVGVWVEAQLELRDEYEKAIYEMAKAGKLGWSSGTAAHLVSKKSAGTAREITRWPLGLDASVTPTPAEPRNAAMTLKAWAASLEEAVPAKAVDIESDPDDGETEAAKDACAASPPVPDAEDDSAHTDAAKRLQIEVELMEIEYHERY